MEAQTAPEAEGGGDPGAGADAEAGDDEGEDLFSADMKKGDLLVALPGEGNDPEAEEEDPDEIKSLSIDDVDAPIKAQEKIKNAFGQTLKKSRRVTSGPEATHMPDFVKMTSVGKAGRKQDTMNKPFDNDFLNDPFGEATAFAPPRLTHDLVKTLGHMSNKIGINSRSILTEVDNLKKEDPNGEA